MHCACGNISKGSFSRWPLASAMPHDNIVSAGVTPTPRKTSVLRVPNLTPSALQSKPSRAQIPTTSLTPLESANALEFWDTYIRESYLTQYADLVQLMHSLQVPLQPISQRVCEDEFKHSKGRFSYRDFVTLLERLKTLHGKWLHKLRGKALDDDLLEAFVAVGGQSDSNGEVDLAKMRAVVGEFHLNVDVDKIIAEMDNDGSANIDFGEFASLIRDSHGDRPSKGDDEDPDDAFDIDGLDGDVGSNGGSPSRHAHLPTAPITLSSMMYVDEELDQALLFPPMGLTTRKDAGELSTRKRSEFNLLTHRKRSMMAMGSGDAQPLTPGGATPVASTQAAGAKRGPVGVGNNKLAPIDRRTAHPGRTQLARGGGAGASGAGAPGGSVHGGATAFYKGGGGLRNLTPAPTSSITTASAAATAEEGRHGGPPDRASSSLAMGANTRGSPQRGTVRPVKKHKFAN